VNSNLHRKSITEDIAICWTLHSFEDHSAITAALALLETEVEAVIEGVRKIRSPSFSLTFASVSGDIWLQGTGIVPIRPAFSSVPLDGSDSRNDWKGFVSEEEMPFVLNPAKGFIVTANNNPAHPSYKHFYSLGSEYSEGRAERITELVQEQIHRGHKLTSQDFMRMQEDEVDVLCRDALPQMLALTEHSPYWEEMSRWNCDLNKDRVEPHVYYMWIRLFSKALVQDELPEYSDTLVAVMWYRYSVYRMMALLPTDRSTLQTDRWCDDIATSVKETCAQLLSSTFKEAVAAVGNTRWGKVHLSQMKHLFSSNSLLRPYFHRTLEVGGSDVTPHATTSSISKTFDSQWGPDTRVVMDLGTDELYWAVEGGNHGSVFSKFYDNFVEQFNYGPLVKTEFNEETAVGEQSRIWPH
jgi:penicillin amidase